MLVILFENYHMIIKENLIFFTFKQGTNNVIIFICLGENSFSNKKQICG